MAVTRAALIEKYLVDGSWISCLLSLAKETTKNSCQKFLQRIIVALNCGIRLIHHIQIVHLITQWNLGGGPCKSNASRWPGKLCPAQDYLIFQMNQGRLTHAVAAAFLAKYFALLSLFICISIFSSSVKFSLMSVTFPRNNLMSTSKMT